MLYSSHQVLNYGLGGQYEPHMDWAKVCYLCFVRIHGDAMTEKRIAGLYLWGELTDHGSPHKKAGDVELWYMSLLLISLDKQAVKLPVILHSARRYAPLSCMNTLSAGTVHHFSYVVADLAALFKSAAFQVYTICTRKTTYGAELPL